MSTVTTTHDRGQPRAASPAAGLRQRKAPDTRVNLSSNELRHPAVLAVLRDAWAETAPEQAWCYPRNAADIEVIGRHFGLDSGEFQLTPGSDSALRLLCARARHLFPDGPRLLLQSPNYPAWEEAARHHGIPVHRIGPLRGDVGRQVELLVNAARFAPPSLIAVSVPNGPVGWGMTDDEVHALERAAYDGGHLLVLDACYQAFSGPLRAALARRGDHVAVVQTLSKSHGLAGARVALLATSAARLDTLGSASLEQAVAGPSLALAKAVLRREDALTAVWSEVVRMRAEAARHLTARGLEPLPSRANFLTVRVGPDVEDVIGRLDAAGYRVRSLHTPGGHLDGCLRFTVTSEPECREFLAALDRATGRTAA
ncbi:aminotransferase class I/II-fold pyridoxal phosphate-dependent enzyme [Streptomyces sp. NPDC046909]|uniref:aminotransferase class I/II-fold pyridoxal phosphate-dependent enzyme n=1 Tax=Streptomyces sp. NPDC046909 TaxID=3155617 RepID=UPI0033FBC586